MDDSDDEVEEGDENASERGALPSQHQLQQKPARNPLRVSLTGPATDSEA